MAPLMQSGHITRSIARTAFSQMCSMARIALYRPHFLSALIGQVGSYLLSSPREVMGLALRLLKASWLV